MKFCYLWVLCALVVVQPLHAAERIEVIRNVDYVQRESGPLAMDIYMPRGAGPFPGVLVVHGGAWMIGTRSQLAAVANSLAERGYTAACVSYRLAPKYPFPAQVYDCQAAVRWLRGHSKDYKIDPEYLGGFGYSAGGQLVALLGTMSDEDLREEGVAADAPSARLQAVVAGGTPCDFRVMPEKSTQLAYWLGGSRADKPNEYRSASPAAFISADDPPMFFFHGARDLLVPAHSPQRMVALLTEAGTKAEIHLIKDAGHIEALFDSETLEMALQFADTHLKGKTSASGKGTITEVTADKLRGGASNDLSRAADKARKSSNGASNGE
jgi:triacylglycerol lipase